eukprot:TRINITY_DN10273_c0_g1_i3.p1 TRINITY_DN10273_c0_g1~~TRINITY_DN10273_c0_g1_i3.p1  ORF type:complete len:342 (-),score=74.97 TRINITY_DN10273_c0_g1_i3:145-1170(-)
MCIRDSLMTYIFSLGDSMINLLLHSSTFENMMIPLERCFAFTRITSEKNYQMQTKESQELSEWPTVGSITFRNVFVRYRPSLDHVLRDVTLDIRPCEKIAIVGRTGSGKSTIILTLLRILEVESGVIKIDGLDISQIGLFELRNKITIIPQDPSLFEGTVRFNLDPQGNHSDEEIWNVLEMVCLKDSIESEGGLDANVRENGENFSAGEKQLLCIARAILKSSKIILIDEATSNVDVRTDHIIQNVLQTVFRKSTVLTISHRLNSVIHADRVLVLQAGAVAEFENPNVLLRNPDSLFAGLWKEANQHEQNQVARSLFYRTSVSFFCVIFTCASITLKVISS